MHKRIVLTGGHAATTALATAEELVRRGNWDIYWIGSASAVEGKDIPTLESKIFPAIGVSSYSITTGRIQRRLTLWSIPSLFKIPIGFFQALKIIGKIKPDIILSFGGFASFPTVLAGWIYKIPIIVHEQTMAGGLANRASSFFATKVAVAREESIKLFQKEKCVIVGNPILTQISKIEPKDKIDNPPNILISCGSRGAQRINNVVDRILEKLLIKYRILHITGILDYRKFAERKEKLPSNLRKNYEVYSTIDPMKIDRMYKEADIVIGRAGANTVSEIIAAKRPAILIPIPWTRMDEQTLNANFARDFGIARVLTEEKLSENSLLKAVEDSIQNWNKIVKGVHGKRSPDINAAERLVNLLKEYI